MFVCRCPDKNTTTSSDDEEDVLEMVRNLALLSKEPRQTSAEDEEELRDEDVSADEDEGPGDDDDDDDETDSNLEDDGVCNVQSHTEGNLKKRKGPEFTN